MRRSLGGIGGVEEETSGVVVDGVGDSIWARGQRVFFSKEGVRSQMIDDMRLSSGARSRDLKSKAVISH
jgi:hypothetical protein